MLSGPKNQKSADASVYLMACPCPVWPPLVFQSMRTLKRLLLRQATVVLATHVADDGFRYDCTMPKLVANAPSTFSTAASQPACGSCPTGAQPPKSWPTTSPLASMSGDPELPPYVPPTSLAE